MEDLDRQVLAGLAQEVGAFLLEHDTGTMMRVHDLVAFFEITDVRLDGDVVEVKVFVHFFC